MIGIRSLAGREADNLNIEWMTLVQVRGVRLASQCFRNSLACANELCFGRRPGFFDQLIGVYLFILA
jgi:hypothetical protein